MENVKSLALRIKTTNKELLALMKEAGLKQTTAEDEVSPQDQKIIVAHLKEKRDAEQEKKPKILSLKLGAGSVTQAPGKVNVLHKRKTTAASALRTVEEINARDEREKDLAQKAENRKLEAQQKLDNEAEELQERKRAAAKKAEQAQAARLQTIEAGKKTPQPSEAESTASKPTTEAKAPPRQPQPLSTQKKTIDSTRDKATPTKRRRGSRTTTSGSTTTTAPIDLVQLNEFVRANKKGGQQAASRNPLKSGVLSQRFQRPTTTAKDITISDTIVVSELAHLLGVKAPALIKELMKLGFMATVNQSIDYETATLAAAELGHATTKKAQVDIEQQIAAKDVSHTATPRPPVVTVMGHVDHGKTSLLDYIRHARVVDNESGGITQHIGAYHVATDRGQISFLDTPGHAAFTSMRARGALITDIVILVVASDDKVMPQTIEAIEHAQSANVPIVVALNKIDRPEADPDRLINELSAHELVPEEWGGDVQFLRISATTGEGVDKLLEAVSLQAEMLELVAPEDGNAQGAVIESRLDKHRGPLATILVRDGTLKKGDDILVGACIGRVRAMYNDLGQQIDSAGPSMPVEIIGLSDVPEAGDSLVVFQDEKAARELAESRKHERKGTQQFTPAVNIEDVFSNLEQSQNQKVLNLIIKADTRGSIEAIKHSLLELETDDMKVNLVISGTGGITETDVSLAQATQSKVIGFHVRADSKASKLAEKSSVKISYYSVIYELIDDIDSFLHGLLDPLFEEKILGTAEVRDIFSASRFGKIAGCMTLDGVIHRNKPIRVIRNNTVIYEGELESLRRFKEDVPQVRAGTECGIGVKGYKDVRSGDRIEVFERTEVDRKRTVRGKNTA